MSKLPSDIVIVSAVRTAVGKAKKGAFKDTHVEDLLAAVISGALNRVSLKPSLLGDIVVGTVLGSGSQRANEARIGAFLAGVPDTVPIHTVNRQCSSGLQSLAHVAANIKAGYYDIGLACGVESMSSAQFGAYDGQINPRVFLNKEAKACLLPMGITSENVAARFNIGRAEQDQFAALSHQRAAAAIKAGKFKGEIVPVTVQVTDKTGASKSVVVDTDEGVREETTAESLGKLKPAFDAKGSSTAGNSSQVSDGAAAVLAMKRETALKLGLKPLATFRGFAVTGVAPEIMGIGPATAIPAVLAQVGLSIGDISVFEINEAFASQALYCAKHLSIPAAKLNPNGGAIALGHPLGCTGARQVATIIPELERTKGRFGVISMCIGSGMGAAAVIERED